MKKTFSVGEIVQSMQGRDKENLYLIYRITCDKIYLVNGDNKLITSPKVKNPNHIVSKNMIVESLRDKILQGKTIFDAEVYSILKKFKQNLKGE